MLGCGGAFGELGVADWGGDELEVEGFAVAVAAGGFCEGVLVCDGGEVVGVGF